jgi:hypothetical protein
MKKLKLNDLAEPGWYWVSLLGGPPRILKVIDDLLDAAPDDRRRRLFEGLNAWFAGPIPIPSFEE